MTLLVLLSSRKKKYMIKDSSDKFIFVLKARAETINNKRTLYWIIDNNWYQGCSYAVCVFIEEKLRAKPLYFKCMNMSDWQKLET